MTAKRNEERNLNFLNRWVEIYKEISTHSREKRPNNALECNNLQDCERWRKQILRDINGKVSDIQNSSLGEIRIRKLNDEINDLFKEKDNWEERIKMLGGVDYKKIAPKNYDIDGYEIPNNEGYKYWGAAKDLPGVRELLIKKVPNLPNKNIMDVYKKININYYGNNEDEELEKQEKLEEEMLYLDYLDKNEEEGAVKIRKLEDKNLRERKKQFKKENEELKQFEIIHKGVLFDENNNKIDEEKLKKEILIEKKKQLISLLNKN
jgi:pre-mRNA-splicing factor ISY1